MNTMKGMKKVKIETNRLIITEFTMDMAEAVPVGDGSWEVGYHIGENYTGQGYATEAVTAFMPMIMNQIGITEMTGTCLADNKASIKVMEHLVYLSLINSMFHLSKFPSAAFSSVYVATATPSSSVLQSENLSCVKHTAIKGYKLIYKNVRRKEQWATDKYRKV